MDANVCKFVSTRKPDEGINVINFVYEKEADFKQDYIISSTYSLALVTGGSGVLHTFSGNFDLSEGSLFVTFSTKPYYIENCGGLQYIYISFTGLRTLALMERMHISYESPVFYDFHFLKDIWENALNVSDDKNIDLFCEGLILYSLGFVCAENTEADYAAKPNGILLAKQYVDLNYTDCTLNLKTVSEKFSYSPKYFSAAFKNMVRINFSDYLKNRRLSYAISLIESGITNVKDLSELCGYSDSLYFSKCFKEAYGVSPKKWFADRVNKE